MTEWVLSSCILILVVITLRTVFKGRISLRLQYAIWGLVLLRLLIPVSFGSTDFSVANLTAKTEAPSIVIQSTKPGDNQQADHPVQHPQEQPDKIPSQNTSQNEPVAEENGFDLRTYMSYIIWGIGFICVAGLFLFTNLRFKHKLMGSRYVLDVQKNNLDVYATGEIDTPCLFGIKNPAIYVTYPVADNQTLLRHTLEHEATHHRHGDHIWAVLRCVCLAIHWYNPLVWWAAFLSQRDAELACDEATIKRLGEGERAEYGRTLIGMTCQKKANVLITATTMNSGKSGIRERIFLIAKKPKMALYTLLIVVLVASIAVGCTFTGAKDDSTGDLTGTKVFSNQSEVTGMAIHALPDAYTLVDSAYLSDMAEWALGFEYGDIIDSNAVMDPGSNTYSVTLYYADGTEQTSCLDFETVDELTYAISREDVPGCWHDIWADEDNTETQPLETETPDDAPPENLPEVFAKEPDDNKVCIAVQPTGLVSEGGAYLYIIPEEQVIFLEHYQAAVAAATEDLSWDNDLRHSGWWVVYQGQWWQMMEGGAMYGIDGTVGAEDGKELYVLCDDAVKKAGVGDPIRPEEITDIKSATLSWNGTHTVTDPYALHKIEKWIGNSRQYGSASCWFTAQLTLELENGETKTISMATDSCATWMSEGVVYSYGEVTNVGVEGNEEFYSLFASDIIHEKAKEGPDALADYWVYTNWRMYSNTYSIDETFGLMDMFQEYALSNPTDWIVRVALTTARGLDGAYAQYYAGVVAALYEADPAAFRFACRQMLPEQDVNYAAEMLALQWNITPEEAHAKLEAETPQN